MGSLASLDCGSWEFRLEYAPPRAKRCSATSEQVKSVTVRLVLKLFLIKFSGFKLAFARKVLSKSAFARKHTLPRPWRTRAVQPRSTHAAAIQPSSPSSDAFRATLRPGAALTAPCEAKLNSEKIRAPHPPGWREAGEASSFHNTAPVRAGAPRTLARRPRSGDDTTASLSQFLATMICMLSPHILR